MRAPAIENCFQTWVPLGKAHSSMLLVSICAPSGKSSQRFTWGWGLGRADHVFEGFVHYTNIGTDPMFKAVIASFTADERTNHESRA